jgi:hypothetical protein
MPGLKTLIFVYNTDSSVLQAIKDYSVSTSAVSRADDCTLCAVTHSPVGMKKEWKRFLRNLEIPSRFLNRNEFFSEFGPSPITFPVVLLQNGTEMAVLICSEELNLCRTLNDIIDLIGLHLPYARGGNRVTSHSQNVS